MPREDVHPGIPCLQPGWLARIVIAALVPPLFLGCAPQSSIVAHPTPSATGRSSPTGACATAPSAWRAAYLGQDGRLHTVSLDGKTDRAGQMMPGLTMQGLTIYAWGVSPDGRRVAYSGGSADLSADNGSCEVSLPYGVGGYALAWSPDSRHLAEDRSGKGEIRTVDVTANTRSAVPVTSAQKIDGLIGWADASHLVVHMPQPGAVALGSLDLTTGQVRTFATISPDRLGLDRERLSPDGSEVLVYNNPFRDDPYTPLVEVINVASGQIRSLPNIARAASFGFTTMVWKPGAEIGAASTGYAENGNLKAWVLDLAHDTIAHLVDGRHVEGWAPDGGPLVIGTGYPAAAQIGAGPFTLSAITFSPSGQPSIVPLTQSAMTFPFLGFVQES